MTDEKRTLPSDWWLIKIDERGYWLDSKVLARTKHVYAVYAFDRNTHVHCCEITPSYELTFLGHDAEEVEDLSDEEREELDEIIISVPNEEPVTYMHVSYVDRMLEANPHLAKQLNYTPEELDFEEDSRQQIDQVMEDWHTGSIQF